MKTKNQKTESKKPSIEQRLINIEYHINEIWEMVWEALDVYYSNCKPKPVQKKVTVQKKAVIKKPVNKKRK